jgi:hypothetical protein
VDSARALDNETFSETGRLALTWNIEELRGFEHARLVLVNFAEVLVQLLEFLFIDWPVTELDRQENILTVEVGNLLLSDLLSHIKLFI